MTETSTPTTNFPQNDMVQKKNDIEDLGEEELSFYAAISGSLYAISRTPSPEVVSRLLSYSKSL